MKSYIIKYNVLFCLLLLLSVTACDPEQDDKIELPPPPENVGFTVTDGAEPNHYILQNTTPDVFQYAWDLGNGTTATGEEVTAFYAEKGDYEVSLTVFGAGGSSTATQVIAVEEDAPVPCAGNPLYEFLSDCNQKVWMLKPVEGAFWVGPEDASTTWWSNSEAEVTARSCAFNDTWTFTGDGKMIYETNGDIWGEDYLGFDFECVDESQLSASQAAWGSGTHSYAAEAGSPDQLTLTGSGAFMGLPKVANGAEVTEPQDAVTYDIIRMESDGTTDEMELEVNVGGALWRFIYISQ